MKKVLIVIGSALVNAGVPNVVMKVVRLLHNEYKFDIVVGSSIPGYFDKEFLSYGGKIYKYDKITYGDGKLKIIIGGKQTYKFIYGILKEQHYDIVHSNEGYLSGWVLKAASDAGVPVRIAHSHGTYIVQGKNIPVRIFKIYSMRKALKYSTNRLACSSIAGKTLFCGEDFVNILNPIDIEPYLLLKKESHKNINLIQIGYYCKLKNQLYTIEVLRELLKKGIDARVSFIGYDDGSGYLRVVKEKIKKYNLENQVTFYPSDADKLSIFPRMDFLLLPSSSEGLPLTALEAQASRTYCIASTHVPEDCDMGMFFRINVDSSDSALKCADWIIMNREYKDTLDIEKISALNTNNWVHKIASIYETALNSSDCGISGNAGCDSRIGDDMYDCEDNDGGMDMIIGGGGINMK